MLNNPIGETEHERRILVNAMHATNANRAVNFGNGDRGDLARKMHVDGLLDLDATGTLPGHVYYTITDAGRTRLEQLGGDR